MGKALRKYMNVDVVAFLEEQMKKNTVSYQGDFEYDKEIFQKCVASERKEDRVLLWLSRQHGTQCVKEHDAFLRGTEGYTTWQYYAEQESKGNYVAFAVELISVQDGVIKGNLYELDYLKHAEMVKRESQPACDVLKTFEDGFVAQAALARSSHGYWFDLVEKHGAIVDSLGVPSDVELLALTLSEQRRERSKMKEAAPHHDRLEDVLEGALQRSSEGSRGLETGSRESMSKC